MENDEMSWGWVSGAIEEAQQVAGEDTGLSDLWTAKHNKSIAKLVQKIVGLTMPCIKRGISAHHG